ncbi:hypothetical protein [Magnetospira sp. QH-2]|uniref:hypothetical protein n=1 Tax=Magnetospira sp. (strain QH-2) TaxID=1288970 RepID=UPI0003E80D28|nr:hypothetical protein [Magnetospira sp. QH-2]CCQ75529.1 Conserved protein of unknown function [Magnetospira sp. QH-2]
MARANDPQKNPAPRDEVDDGADPSVGIVSPIVMGLLFLTTILPIALLMRLFARDPLHRRLDPHARTYWIDRKPPAHGGASMNKQY